MSYSGSGDDQGNNQSNNSDQEGPIIHGAFPYISLIFKLTLTLIIILMASLVCVTIKKTKRLHRPHNILVANVMIADIVLALWDTIPASISIIGYAAGTNIIHCGLLNFAYHPVIVYHITFIMISIDKVIAIGLPFKYKNIMTNRVVAGMICLSWVLAILVSFHTLFVSIDLEVPEFGICVELGRDFLWVILTYAIPILVEAVVTTLLNMYLATKSFQIQKQIQKESRLSGVTSQVEALRQKQCTIKKHMKPILTLLVILLCNSLITLVVISIYIPGRFLVNDSVYHHVMEYVVRPNVIYFSPFLHLVVYGIHFKQIREPMKNMVLSYYTGCKQNTTAVTPQS